MVLLGNHRSRYNRFPAAKSACRLCANRVRLRHGCDHAQTTNLRHMLHLDCPHWSQIRDVWNGRFENSRRRSLRLPPGDGCKVTSHGEPGVHQQRFSAMLMQRTISTLLWLSGAGGAFALGCLLVIVADDGNIHAAALIAFFWTAALLAGAIHHFVGRADTSHRHRREPLAGPRPGACLPG